ncbi:MAG TPA: TonB-dependent receptor, partial [Polyangiaceae bacterium]|nr:TonB-dependent receptor [Polyangiaceae bacterium]
ASRPGFAGDESEPGKVGDGEPRRSVTPATRPDVVPPRLSHFEQAQYPREAEQLGLDATVVLQISIDAKGMVTRVEVREPAGHGFDDAAAAAASRFVFEPAMRAGVRVAARILYRYQFRFEPKSTPASPETGTALPRTGELRGKVVAGTPPAPLAGVSLCLVTNGREPIRIVTDSEGTWRATDLIPGEYVVEVVTTGYRRVRQSEVVREAQVTALVYTLETSDELPLEVTVRGPAMQREVTHYEIPRTELLRVPGTMGDAIHAVEAMPSVARPRGLSGDLIVRGSAPQDSLVHIEGTPVPNVFHYGGLSSVIPGEMLERIEFYPSNFSVRYGRATGGIVEVRMRETNPDGQYHGSAQIDLVNARANVEGPVVGTRNWSLMGGVRASYFDRWLAPIQREGASSDDGLPRYYDFQAYLVRRLAGNGIYRIGVFGAYDTFVPILRDSPNWQSPRQDSFAHVQSQLRLPLSSKVDFRASWSIGRNHNRSTDDHRSRDATYTVGTLRSELSIKTGALGIARLGADVLYAPFKVNAHTDRKDASGGLAGEAIESAKLTDYSINGVNLRPAAYAEYEFAPTTRVDATVGVRLDYAKDTGDIDIAPRLAARYVLVEQPLRTVLKGGLGLFYQPPDPAQTLPELGAVGLTSSHAIHSMLGVEQSLGKRVTVSVEGFEKEMRHLLRTREDGAGRVITESSGTGRVWGADLLLRYSSSDNFFGWVAYTLSRATRKPAADEPEELYRYDQTHILNLLGSYRLGRGWEVGGRFRYASGTIYQSCAGGLFDNATGDYHCYGPLNQQRLSAYHQLDLRVEKVWELKALHLSAYVDVFNVYNHLSPDKSVAKYDYSATKPLSRSLPLLPSVGIRGEI